MDISLLSCEAEHADLLAIDDLLDFSNDDIGGPIDPSENSTPSCELPTLSSHASSPKVKKLPSNQAFCAFDSGELCVPCDDLAELEWLSNFVEESFLSGDHVPSSYCFGSIGKLSTDESMALSDSRKGSYQSTSPVSVLGNKAHSKERAIKFNVAPDMSVPARLRSKRRCRTAVCFWNTQILSAEATESLLESSSTTSTITSDSDMINTYYDHDDDDYNDNEDNDEDGDDDDIDDDVDISGHLRHQQHKRAGDPPLKLKKYNKVVCSFSHSKPKKLKVQDGSLVRKCLHCATTKTPQWRAGPMGPKTLCNACGVRYKSGRLCAEYRPAASPTFIENLHSNSHRKVVEMRRQRGDNFLTPSCIRHWRAEPSKDTTASVGKETQGASN